MRVGGESRRKEETDPRQLEAQRAPPPPHCPGFPTHTWTKQGVNTQPNQSLATGELRGQWQASGAGGVHLQRGAIPWCDFESFV